MARLGLARGDMRRVDDGGNNSTSGYSMLLQPSGPSVESDMTFRSEGSAQFRGDASGDASRIPRKRRHGEQRKKTSHAVRLGMNDQNADNNVQQANQPFEAQERLNQRTYENMRQHDLPNFLDKVHLDGDGGLDRICKLWSNQKIFWAFFLFSFVILNVWYLLSSNWTVFNGFCNHVIKSQSGIWEAALEKAMHGKLDFTNITAATKDLDSGIDDFSKAASASGTSTGEDDIFAHIPNPKRRDLILKMAGVAGTCEVVWVLFFILYIFYEIGVFIFTNNEYKAYSSILHVFQDDLPLLSTFSLMKFMGSVHPALIYNMYLDHVNNTTVADCGMGPSCQKFLTGLSIAYWLLQRIVLASLALFAFSMKLLSVGLKLIDPSHGFAACLIAAFGFMNQCMGCVLFERVLQERVFLFIFGGPDTDFDRDELALKAVYRCRMAKQIWDDYRIKEGSLFKAIVMFATLDHYDIQRLLINEPEEHELRSSQSSAFRRRDSDQSQLASRIELQLK